MQKEQITDKEAICLLIEFVIGSSLILGVGGDAKNDAWISGIVGIVMAIPMFLIFSRLLSLFHGMDLYDILETVLGKILGKAVAIIYIWYSFHLGALVLRNFGEFTRTVAMPETPMITTMFCMGLVCIVGVRLGIEVLGRTTAYFIPVLFFILIVVQLLALPQFHFNYLMPIWGNGFGKIFKGGFSAFSYPFAETVVFVGVFSSLKTVSSPYRVYFIGILISGITVVLATIRNIAILGIMLGSVKFPSYSAVSSITIGDFLQRIEVTVSVVFIFGVFIKSSICLLATCRGIAKVFNLKDYRSIVIQTGLLMIYFSYIVYKNSMEMRYWAFKVYPYYAFPMQVLLPVIIWIISEIKTRKNKELYRSGYRG